MSARRPQSHPRRRRACGGSGWCCWRRSTPRRSSSSCCWWRRDDPILAAAVLGDGDVRVGARGGGARRDVLLVVAMAPMTERRIALTAPESPVEAATAPEPPAPVPRGMPRALVAGVVALVAEKRRRRKP